MKKAIFITSLLILQSCAQTLEVNPFLQRERLLAEEDHDGDKKITIEDKTSSSDTRFTLQTTEGDEVSIEGTYYLSNLLQELTLAQDRSANRANLDLKNIYENPVDRLSRTIRERFWDGLTRKIKAKTLQQVLLDSKIQDQKKFYLYVPHTDIVAWEYYLNASLDRPELNLEVVRLPEKITPEYVESIKDKHGLLTLALRKNSQGKLEGVPYVVPGGRFNEMYGWDSYFHLLGLLEDGRVQLAKDVVDNFVYEINHYGKILNANRTYYLTRSQPPLMTSMIREVFYRLPKGKESRQWLRDSLQAALKEYQTVWMGKDRLTEMDLSRYAGFAPGIPPEVEEGHYNHVFKKVAEGKMSKKELQEFFQHDRAVRESGHDTTYRWRTDGKDRCADFVTVDLNSLLYKYELDFAYLIKNELADIWAGPDAKFFAYQAKSRKTLIRKFLWNSKEKLFFDYDWTQKKQSQYISATAFYPLWAFDPEQKDSAILTDSEAHAFIERGLKELEEAGGVAASSLKSLKKFGAKTPERQWDYPNGWAPHQILIWRGLKNFGHEEDAERLIVKWLSMITENAMNYNGTIPEKYDVVRRSHHVFAEYGNVGTKFSYITREGFGWMNASYQVGLSQLSEKNKKKLRDKMMGPLKGLKNPRNK